MKWACLRASLITFHEALLKMRLATSSANVVGQAIMFLHAKEN
jgi:hypothetical protein